MSTSGFSHRSYYLLYIPHPCQRFFMHGFRIRSGVFSAPRGFRRSLLRPLAEDMSAYACHRSISPQAKYRCVNLVMRMLGSTNLSCRWATVGLLGYLFFRIFFLFPESTKDIKDTHLNELSLSLFPCSKNVAKSLVKVLPCNLKCQKWPQLFYELWGS